MECDKDKIIETELRNVVRKAFNQLIRNIENEPGLILEAADQSGENKQSLTEVSEWLFRRREENDSRDNDPNN